jgi:RNase P subunit RPR2
MQEWLRDLWQKVTTRPCRACGEPVLVTAYRKTAKIRKGSWWAGDEVELECPNCGDTFWAKK